MIVLNLTCTDQELDDLSTRVTVGDGLTEHVYVSTVYTGIAYRILRQLVVYMKWVRTYRSPHLSGVVESNALKCSERRRRDVWIWQHRVAF